MSLAVARQPAGDGSEVARRRSPGGESAGRWKDTLPGAGLVAVTGSALGITGFHSPTSSRESTTCLPLVTLALAIATSAAGTVTTSPVKNQRGEASGLSQS